MEGLHPDQVFDFPVGIGDAVLHFRHHSVNFWRTYAHALTTFDLTGETSNHGHMLQLVADTAIGWDNMTDIDTGESVPYDGESETLGRCLTLGQLSDVVYGLPNQCQLTELERKKSKSPSQSSPENSAKGAVPGDAQTSQVTQTDSPSTVQIAEAPNVTVAEAVESGT